MDGVLVKQEIVERLRTPEANRKKEPSRPISVIDLSSSSSSSDSDDSDDSSSSSDGDGSVLGTNGKRSRVSSWTGGGLSNKMRKTMEELAVVLPVGFLDPLPPKNAASPSLLMLPAVSRPQPANGKANLNGSANFGSSKQFWKAGDYDGEPHGDWDTSAGGLDHVRVHPKFLHSNATSHKWVLGAFAELLDNALDEVCNGATFVNIDMLKNSKDGGRMLLIEDNGGGMDPDKMRQCMSLGYSIKSREANTIGQYGNGFKTSTMRLGADVIVFSRCCGKNGKRPTQSIGLLSYTFLRSTGKEDIVVPMLDYERGGQEWTKMKRSSATDWNKNLQTIVQWSPFSSEADLLRQFNHVKDHGTHIIIYNLWEDDQGQLELDFDADAHDIQIRGVNRDEKKIQMAKQFPNSKHFLTYRHSLRSYASILYLRIPPSFRIILRGKDLEHHNIVNDMMLSQEITYRPQPGSDGVPRDSNIVAVVTIGFVKDAKAHIDVQGFNVYHKNRLIKPFWRLWNAAGSDGRGVIGVLEANFVEPAHDKQGFERTTVLSRLEARLIQMQKTYWSTYCHRIGYAPRRNKQFDAIEISPDYHPRTSSLSKKKHTNSTGKISISGSDKQRSHLREMDKTCGNGHVYTKEGNRTVSSAKSGKRPSSSETSSPLEEDASANEMQTPLPERQANGHSRKGDDVSENGCSSNTNLNVFNQLKEENQQLRERLKRKEEEILGDVLRDLQSERDRCKSLEVEVDKAKQKIEDLNKEQESLIDIFSEERERRDIEEENLRKKLKDASNTIQELLDKVKLLEKMKSPRN
ncbi:protein MICRORCHIDIA 7 [Actinidia eriantha]|uniref:protein MICRORCHIDIA 7 n=1 Tax=Actinidia eriantha TaxID=165200 RepID=UPI0025892884|nr:protein MICRORCHIDIA 7 [Actinidia eriantha]